MPARVFLSPSQLTRDIYVISLRYHTVCLCFILEGLR